MKEMRGYPELTQAPQEALVDIEREKLWQLSEQLTNTVFDFIKINGLEIVKNDNKLQ
jgi:hypothetical protein